MVTWPSPAEYSGVVKAECSMKEPVHEAPLDPLSSHQPALVGQWVVSHRKTTTKVEQTHPPT